MSGLTSVLYSGLSGLRAAQTALGVASNNVANANTPGYVRTETILSPRTQLGAGAGVEVTGVKRAADRFLATASYIASAAHGAASVRADLLSRAQASFGDPASDTSMFATLDDFWASMTEIGVDPSSSLRRSDAVSNLQATFDEMRRIGQSLQDLTAEADARIGEAVSQAQNLMNRIADLNDEIRLNKRTGADASGAENAQSALIDQLSSLMDVRTTAVAEGGVQVRTSGGALLVGVTAATISYTPNASPFTSHSTISLNADTGAGTNLEPTLLGGEIKGLLQVRDEDLPNLSDALGGFAGALANVLNRVHNDSASSPAVGQMIGRQTGLLGSDAIGFTGKSIVAVTGANGVLAQRLTIDFDAKTITGEAPAGVFSFSGGTVNDFTTALNSALASGTPSGSATFANGVLTLNGGGGGLVVQQDATNPSARALRGFSHFFGLNDLVSRPTPSFFTNGIKSTDLHGLNAGGGITYQIRDAAGRLITQRTVSISGALAGPTSTMGDLVNALNATGTGVGEYGAFSLNSQTGQITFAPSNGYQVDLVSDTTKRGTTGVSFTALYGLSPSSTGARALELNIDAEVAADPNKLAVGHPDLTAAIGTRVIEAGDNRGAAALVAARDAVQNFGAAGSLSAQSSTLALYATRLGGEAGRLSADAARAAAGAEAVSTAANDRRAQIEGVSLDDELMKMTTFQNAYAAAARVIQAASDMMDILLSIGYR